MGGRHRASGTASPTRRQPEWDHRRPGGVRGWAVLQVEQVLSEVGLIAGQPPAGRALGELRVEGVAAVEEARTVRLPPPDAPVQ